MASIDDLKCMVQALGPEEALGNLRLSELKEHCKNVGLKLAGNKLDIVLLLGAHLMATNEASKPEQELVGKGKAAAKGKGRPKAAAQDKEANEETVEDKTIPTPTRSFGRRTTGRDPAAREGPPPDAQAIAAASPEDAVGEADGAPVAEGEADAKSENDPNNLAGDATSPASAPGVGGDADSPMVDRATGAAAATKPPSPTGLTSSAEVESEDRDTAGLGVAVPSTFAAKRQADECGFSAGLAHQGAELERDAKHARREVEQEEEGGGEASPEWASPE